MKRFITTTLIIAFVAAPLVSGAASKYVSSFTPGSYKGYVVSVHPDINDTEATMKITRRGDKVVATVTYADSTEEWVWNAKTLTQTEYSDKRKVLRRYTATAKGSSGSESQRFVVNCKKKNSCTEEIDPRHNWVLETTGDSVTYSVYGVPVEKWGDASAEARGRHILRFSRVDAVATK